MKHPMQPLVKDANGVIRFKANRIVRHLLDHGGIDLNAIAILDVPQDDRVQFAQLIGYSLSGFHELNEIPDTAALAASLAACEAGFSDVGGCRDAGCEIHCGVEEEKERAA